jgi:hypothetical protein
MLLVFRAGVFRKICIANLSLGVFRVEELFRFFKLHSRKRRVPESFSTGGNVEVTDAAETGMKHV